LSCDFDSLSGFIFTGGICRVVRALQLIASAPQVAERPEAGSELCSHGPFHGLVAAAGGSAHALLR